VKEEEEAAILTSKNVQVGRNVKDKVADVLSPRLAKNSRFQQGNGKSSGNDGESGEKWVVCTHGEGIKDQLMMVPGGSVQMQSSCHVSECSFPELWMRWPCS